MLVLYTAMKYNYGAKEQGYSFEHHNFYDTLLNLGHDILYFDFMTLMQERGRKWMNRRLLEVVKAEKPHLMFTVLFADELDRATVREISENTDTITFNWFCDDHWRFDNYSRHWAPCFNWVATTAASALPKYAKLGYRNVIKSQWACNHFLYRKMDLPLKYDVTFVGQPHGNRRQIIQALRHAGIDVQAWGGGWEAGRISQDQMIEIFNQSRINLNLANASVPTTIPKPWTKAGARRLASRSLNVVPFGQQIRSAGKTWFAATKPSSPAKVDATTAIDLNQQYSEQIKGRNFEVPGCGGFMLTGQADNLEDYYRFGKEVVCFDNVEDLIDKARYYLSHEDERDAIARAGYQRTMGEHTYVHRFEEIFRNMGLPWKPNDKVMAGKGMPGRVEDVS